MMQIIPEFKACESCAKSKRKCGKEQPKCHRCASRDLQCEYPLARPSSFVLLQDDLGGTPQSSATSSTAASTVPLWSPSMLLGTLPDFDLTVPSSDIDLQLARPPSTPAKHLSCDWFMSPDTWESTETIPPRPILDPIPQPFPPYSNIVLKRFLKDLQRRLSGWIANGCTTFIHKQLHQFRRPRCISDAQTALALYLCRTDENEEMIFRTLDDRVAQLLLDEEKHRASSSHNTFDHLARVQALLTYQIIGLLDGDIHQRAAAEERTKLLMTWLDQMIESVQVASAFVPANGIGDCSVVAKGLGLGVKDILPDDQAMFDVITQEEVIWQIWLFTESLRRTWAIVQGLCCTYHALKKGWAECPRSMKITAGRGLWDAPSSFAWAQVIQETNVWFIEGKDTETLLMHTTPDKVDEFTKSFMEIEHGMERMERWEVGAVF